MRSIYGVFAVMTILGLATAATAAQPCCGNQGTWTGYAAYEAYCAPACASPGYGMVPGCCELPPTCCDHVWDGYCQELRGLDAVRALFPYRGCCGRGAGLRWGGGACGPVGAGCCVVDSVPGSVAGEQAAEGLVQIPVAPRRDP
jgi:hypothetical protein